MTIVSPRLAGKCAYITGAAGGLGRAIARRMVEQGARVFLTDIAEAGQKWGRWFDGPQPSDGPDAPRGYFDVVSRSRQSRNPRR